MKGGAPPAGVTASEAEAEVPASEAANTDIFGRSYQVHPGSITVDPKTIVDREAAEGQFNPMKLADYEEAQRKMHEGMGVGVNTKESEDMRKYMAEAMREKRDNETPVSR